MDPLELQDADAVVALFRRATEATRDAACRRGSLEVIHAPARIIATGDLHDNPIHLEKLERVARVGPFAEGDESTLPHLTLHEIIHSDRLISGVDLSYRALARVAHLKTLHPERVHMLLANHELAQVVGSGIVKNGVRCVDAFNDGLEWAFSSRAEEVAEAIGAYIRALPLALRAEGPRGVVLCSHSLPGPAQMARFDPGVLDRELTEDDYTPLTGSAHLMVWGRGYDAEQLEDLVERWGVSLFVLGHEHADTGVDIVRPCAVVLNSDHARGVYLPINLDNPPDAHEAPFHVMPLAAVH